MLSFPSCVVIVSILILCFSVTPEIDLSAQNLRLSTKGSKTPTENPAPVVNGLSDPRKTHWAHKAKQIAYPLGKTR
jgi:hypothetical protein